MTSKPTSGATALDLCRQDHGFVGPQMLAIVAGDNETRLTLLLVRCGGGRFMAPAQDVQHFMDIIKADGRDYVRDVSLPAQG